MRPKLVAFGNVLLDFTFSVEKNPEILSEYGFESNGLGECSSETLSKAITNAKKTCEFLSSQTGGSALNTSKILSLLGETEHIFCGAIGNDVNGSVVRKQLEEAGLKACLQIIEGQTTGTCVCLINKENRSCYGNVSSSIHFNKEFLLTQDLIEPTNSNQANGQIFYLEGFFITAERFPFCKYIIDEICKPSAGLRKFATNLSAEYLIENQPDQMKYLAENATILFGNRDEFSKLAQLYRLSSAVDVIAHLMNEKSNGVLEKLIICTQGSDSVLYSSRSEGVLNKSFHFKAISKDKIIDTTGCGDAFVAGFFYAFLRNESIERCVSKGVEVALKKITSIGGNISTSQ